MQLDQVQRLLTFMGVEGNVWYNGDDFCYGVNSLVVPKWWSDLNEVKKLYEKAIVEFPELPKYIHADWTHKDFCLIICLAVLNVLDQERVIVTRSDLKKIQGVNVDLLWKGLKVVGKKCGE